ncbi:MAG: putative baseplate assembly protein [Actinobacteria bacterium]|uniref:Unannotated protein n=1 Tax=freshwater metagenome TaxID=449393 RepID=A0A6J7II50_9ZZZZ|nr:putative baseplate assembly protein [Actinomycetota bacterium]
MTLPAPNLDDRGFQDLVDEAKRLVQLRNPEWTDHNVSDPGVTLIETFAYMTDQLIYRLNRVPDLHYVKFLDLLGEKMIPPAAAVARIEFWLSVAQDVDISIPRGTLVSTVRTGNDRAVTFATIDDFTIPAVDCRQSLTKAVDGGFENHDERRALREEFPVFSSCPQVGDALYIGLTQAASHCFVRLVIASNSDVEGIGVDPLNPPYIVEAWDGQKWGKSRILSDDTGGLNRSGNIDLSISEHVASTIGGVHAAWLRIIVVETVGSQPAYLSTPEILHVEADTLGGVIDAAHSEPIENELLGPCTGTPGDRLHLSQVPLVAGQMSMEIEVSGVRGWTTWTRVESFAESGPMDRHFVLDEVSGQLRFGPVIRLPEGGSRGYGATPEPQAMVRIPRYLVGGGLIGNVESRTLSVLRTSIPFISTVVNLQAAYGGSDAETLEDVKERAAITVRTQMRAVTARDYELLVATAAPSIARVSCIDATSMGKPGHVLIQVVPRVTRDVSDFDALQPREEVLKEIRNFIDPRRPLGAVVHVEPPKYLGVSVVARIALEPGASQTRVVAEADAALRSFMHPVEGGYDGKGWPFGHPLLLGDVHARLQRIPGLAYVDVVRLVPVDIVTGVHGTPGDKVQAGARDLLFCVGNEIEVVE